MESHSHDILSTKFDGKNYSMWEFHLQIFVQGKRLFGILDGSTTDLRPFNLAAETWKHLKKVYSQCNHAQDFELENTLSEYKQGDKDIQSYYSGLMAI
ncbi:hypothetical protein R3W88_016349 [Solanum pinnatisectum]|uniref:Retrotransposon Copia-like N-terminal domain-containing protein n=1 Tax=Solanum pinnatisectum TaxID=50273 RepID=A0AAV9KXK0_9SOLN|nr:hypothetical protein R3W88_016349 [Solanum pinnatisectum]